MDYLLKASAVLIMFYVCHFLFLRRETFFQSNRWFLLAGLVVSICIPFLVIPIYIEYVPADLTGLTNTTSTSGTTPITPEPFDYAQLLMWLYISGIVFFFGKLCVELFSLRNLLNATQLKSNAGFKLLETSEAITPFSFFNRIVYNPEQFDSEELKHIINHEKVHVSQWHSLDLLIAQICCVLFWFNPFIWGYKRAIQQNLEFIADGVAQGTSEENKAYQTVLLKTCLQTNPLQLTNNFYTSLIKTRILMLHKSKSKRLHKLKLLVILPLLAGFMMSFNTEDIYMETSNPLENPKTRLSLLQDRLTVAFTKDAEESYFVQAKASLAKKGITFIYKDINRNSSNEITAIHVTFKSKTQITEYKVNGNEPIQPFIFESDADTFKARTLVKGQDIMYDIVTDQYNKPITSDSTIVIIEKLKNDTDSNDVNSADTLLVDSFEDDILVFKDEKNKTAVRGADINNVLFILDEKKVSKKEIDNLSPKEITSVEVFKGDKAIKSYGKAGRHGVIVIKTKPTSGWAIGMPHVQEFQTDTNKKSSIYDYDVIKNSKDILGKTENDPVFILDEKMISKNDFNALNPDDIRIIEVIKGDMAYKIYGEEGKNGVIMIETKAFDPLSKERRASFEKLHENSKVEVNAVSYMDDENENESMSLVYLYKTSTDKSINQLISTLKRYDIKTKISKVKRNSAGDIIQIKISIGDNEGRETKMTFKDEKGIKGIMLGKKEGALIITESDM